MLQIGDKLENRQCCHNLWTWRHRQTFWGFRVFLVNFSFWSKFHINIMTSSGVRTIFVYKELIRNPEIRKSPVWVLPNIWRLGQVRDTRFVTNVSHKKLLNAAKYQGYGFHPLWVIKTKATGGIKLPPPTQTGLKIIFNKFSICCYCLTSSELFLDTSLLLFTLIISLLVFHTVFMNTTNEFCSIHPLWFLVVS